MEKVTIKDLLQTLAMFSDDSTIESFKCVINTDKIKFNICVDDGKIKSFENK